MSAAQSDFVAAYIEMHDAWFDLDRETKIELVRDCPGRIVDFIDAIVAEEGLLGLVKS